MCALGIDIERRSIAVSYDMQTPPHGQIRELQKRLGRALQQKASRN